MSPEYKSVSDRHRVLEAVEELWAKYPTKDLVDLLVSMRPKEVWEEDFKYFTDSKLCRAINRRLR